MYTVRMRHPFLFLAIPCVFLGAGCRLFAPITTPSVAERLGTALPERPIAQERGFGSIPAIPSPRLRPGTGGSVRLTTTLPSIPPSVTVLRIRSNQPNDAQIRNIAASFDLPGGIVGNHPIGQELLMSWKDGDGIRWSFDAAGRSIDFSVNSASPAALTVPTWTVRERIVQKALAFLDDHGVNRERMGTPYLEPDWIAWWETEQSLGRCMTADTIAEIRAISSSSSFSLQPPPALPSVRAARCVTPEFPSRIAVRMNATQDGQAIYDGDGVPFAGAMIYADAATGAVVSGTLAIRAEPDRSDYPAISADDARTRLLSGGQGGTPSGDVTIASVGFEWFVRQDPSNPAVTFLYPALVGAGTIRYANATTAPYSIVVPLVKNP